MVEVEHGLSCGSQPNMLDACVVQIPAAAMPSSFYLRGTPGNVVGRVLRLNPLLHAELLEKLLEKQGWLDF